jgi:hypothetical protein
MSVFLSKKTIKLQLLAELELARLHYYSRFWESFKLLKERLDTQKMYHLLNRLPSSSQALFAPTSYSDCPLIKTTMTKLLMLVALLKISRLCRKETKLSLVKWVIFFQVDKKVELPSQELFTKKLTSY